MNYLKIFDNWTDRYEFLESAPPPYFVIASADGSHIIYKGVNDKTIVENGVTYTFVHAASTMKEQQAIITFDSPLPQNMSLRVQWVVTAANTGAEFRTSTLIPCGQGQKVVTVQAPTTIQSHGVSYDVSNIKNFIIQGHTYYYTDQVIVVTAMIETL